MKRMRAGVVLLNLNYDKVLLIYRKNNKGEYYVIPGGGLENNETYYEAAKREIYEELGIELTNIEMFYEIESEESIEKYFISSIDEDIELEILGEEKDRMSIKNIYIPTWIDLNLIKDINLLPNQIKEEIYNFFIINYKNDRIR